ncbi:MAG: DUF6596 domain-containing protein [Brevibacterium linens]
MPEQTEARGLLALLLLTRARDRARVSEDGRPVPSPSRRRSLPSTPTPRRSPIRTGSRSSCSIGCLPTSTRRRSWLPTPRSPPGRSRAPKRP